MTPPLLPRETELGWVEMLETNTVMCSGFKSPRAHCLLSQGLEVGVWRRALEPCRSAVSRRFGSWMGWVWVDPLPVIGALGR